MKILFFIAITVGSFLGATITANAQTSVNLEKLSDKNKHAFLLKFINEIELTPEVRIASIPANVVEEKLVLVLVEEVATNGSNITIEKCSTLQFKYAMMTDREVESCTNTTLYSFIDEWWATRYHYGGTDKSGIDCSAFVSKVLTAVYGLTTPRTAAAQYNASEKIITENLKEGDLVFFNTRGGVSHVGLYLGNNYFVHSSVSAGVTISCLTDNYYSKKFIGGGRIHGENL